METLIYIALLIPAIPAILAAFKWSFLSDAQRWFAYLLWMIVGVSFSGEIWNILTKESNLPFYHVYILLEYLILLQVFRCLFKGHIRPAIWNTLSIGFLFIWLGNVLFVEGIWGFPDYIHALEAVVILMVVFKWFSVMLKEKATLHPETTFEFWFFAGLLLFFSGNFLLFLFSEFLLSIEQAAYDVIWKVHCILNILLYILYSIALLWVKKPIK